MGTVATHDRPTPTAHHICVVGAAHHRVRFFTWSDHSLLSYAWCGIIAYGKATSPRTEVDQIFFSSAEMRNIEQNQID